MEELEISQVEAVPLIKTAKKANTWRSITSKVSNSENHTITRYIKEGEFLQEVHAHKQTSKFLIIK